jgi:hypothetical protein
MNHSTPTARCLEPYETLALRPRSELAEDCVCKDCVRKDRVRKDRVRKDLVRKDCTSMV